MSHFARQLQIVSSLKSSSSDSDKFLPFCKNLSPLVSSSIFSRPMHTQTLTRNLQLKTEESPKSEGQQNGKKQLAVILSWLLAKGTHIDKYSSLYLNRGFDVLTVKLTPQQMLFPVTGSQVVATNILDYLETNKQYDKVLIHGFSIGGYLLGEIFVKLKETCNKYNDIPDRIVGVIFDSAVDFEGIPTGFPRAVADNYVAVKALEWYIRSHLALMYNVATKHYKKSSRCFHDTPLKCPALMFVSEADKVGTPESNMAVANDWRAKGVEVSFKCWNDSGHVSHMHKHKDEYIGEIDKFLSKLNLGQNEKAETLKSSL